MFEKEAEERYKEHLADPNYYESSEEESYLHGFQEGAEFGYNKAKEEAKDIINELLMNGYDENTREKALNFLYPDKEE